MVCFAHFARFKRVVLTSAAGVQSQAVLTPFRGFETVSPMPMRMFLRLICVVGLLTSCASAHTTSDLRKASAELAAAESEGARDYAPYVFYKASMYLKQARQKNAIADYSTSRSYVKTVFDNLKEAITITRQRKELERRRNELEKDNKRSLPPDLNKSQQESP